jgi:hypothetical protein
MTKAECESNGTDDEGRKARTAGGMVGVGMVNLWGVQTAR